MSNKYLFVAEADKIQDLVFGSSKLREVSGGSQLLTEFCEEIAPKLAKELGGEIIISSGGSFRILFDSSKKAEEFGEYLAELYRRKIGGTITVAEPVEVYSEKEAIIRAQENLRKAKHSGKSPISVEQMPYMAICSSCGMSVARYYKKRHEDEKENYLCEICENKSKARDRIKEKFLSDFYSWIMSRERNDYDFPKDADEVAKKLKEPRNYVAYIVADVNNMGVIFSSCDNFDKLKRLSENLNKIIQQSLVKPTKILMKKLKKQHTDKNIIPILPLILGGDDVFTLIPAQWSLDFTLKFCKEFEREMKKSLEEIGLNISIQPTISASVIICKKNFPYLIAHELGEDLLKEAKRTSKEKNTSTMSFRVITGNEIVKAPEKEKKFIAGFPAYTIEELKKLVEYRFTLKDLPGTRRAQLESLFHKAEDLGDQRGKRASERMESEWLPELKRLLKRLGKTQREHIEQALKELGDPEKNHYWQRVEGSYCHKLPDLLSTWEFAYNLDKEILEYEEVEE